MVAGHQKQACTAGAAASSNRLPLQLWRCERAQKQVPCMVLSQTRLMLQELLPWPSLPSISSTEAARQTGLMVLCNNVQEAPLRTTMTAAHACSSAAPCCAPNVAALPAKMPEHPKGRHKCNAPMLRDTRRVRLGIVDCKEAVRTCHLGAGVWLSSLLPH